MSNNIVEENPTAQPAQAAGAQDKVRKQARQLAYDVRYKVKQGFKDGQKTDPASLKRAFVSQLGKSPAPGPVKALAKKMLIGEEYDFIDVSETVSNSVSNAINSIFVENKKCCEVCGSYDHITEDCPEKKVNEALQEKKYKIRVTDKKTGKSYTRYADRAKISELRKNPNISSVEMTGYGTPYEGEKKKGESTAKVKAGKDFDGDGKVESPTAEYKGSKDKAIKKAIAKEEFIGEINAENENPSANPKKIDVMKGKNKVIINPNMGEQAAPGSATSKPDAKQQRVAAMKKQILQKKMQAVRSGAGADIVAHNELEGEVIKEYDNTKSPDYEKKKKALAKKHGGADKVKGHPQYESKEVKVKDTRRVVDAIRAYDKSKDASDDATADSDEGKTGKAKKEKAYAKKERGEIKKDDPNWVSRKYHTGIHGESVEFTEEFINESVDFATNYFYKQGLNEDGLELVIQDVGIDDFTEFVLDSIEVLNEERSATKAPKRDYEKVKAAVYKKDAERKAKGTGEYSKTKAAKEKYGDKPAPEGKPEKKAVVKKKVEKSVAKAKKVQPAKPTSKSGLGSKIRSVVSKGIERHKAATKKASGEVKKIVKTASDTAKQHAGHRKKFVSGLKATPKEKKIASGVGKAVKKAVVGEDTEPPIKDQTDKQIADVTFDGGGPDGGATIKGTGDPREIPTFVALIKNKLRARGILVSHHEPKGQLVEQGIEDILARLEKKRISKGGNPDASPLGKKTGRAMKAKQDAARKKAGVKTYESTVQSAVDSLNAIAKKEGLI